MPRGKAVPAARIRLHRRRRVGAASGEGADLALGLRRRVTSASAIEVDERSGDSPMLAAGGVALLARNGRRSAPVEEQPALDLAA